MQNFPTHSQKILASNKNLNAMDSSILANISIATATAVIYTPQPI
jgi:hypothetical protein